jgi:type 1 glutamine amidotransferase
MAGNRINCTLIAGGKWHDIDFARLELLKLLAEDDRVRVRVFEDYSNIEAIRSADILVTYTCDVTPGLQAQEELRKWVERGGRWYALHGTNSILRFLPGGKVDTPRWAPHFMETLGSMFLSHPPIDEFQVHVTKPDHPLVQGIAPFRTIDELYLSETYAPLEVLLHCEFEGKTPSFVQSEWKHAQHPLLYIRTLGKGAVLYNALGHCRGHLDLQPMVEFYPKIERCSWEQPVFYELLRRGLKWIKEPVEQAHAAKAAEAKAAG